MKRIFISFPYSHDDQAVTDQRVLQAREYCLKLISEGHSFFSPAISGHDLIHQLGLNPKETGMAFSHWEEFCYSYLDVSDEFHLLKLDGYDRSIGCGGELLRARIKKIPVLEIDL